MCEWITVLACLLVFGVTSACIADPDVDLQRAKGLATARDYAAAIPLLTPIASPSSAIGLGALVLLGDCYSEYGEPVRALDCYQRALSSPLVTQTIRQNVRGKIPVCHLGRRDWAQALSVCRELVAEYPEQTTYWYYFMSQCFARQGNSVEAALLLESALSASSASGDRKMVKLLKAKQAYRAVSARDWATALSIYEELLLQFPEDAPDWQYRIALCRQGNGDIGQALAIFQDLASSSQRGPASRQSELRLAECLYSQGAHDEALAALDQYYTDSPNDRLQALLAKAEFYSRVVNDYNTTVDLCDELIARYPDTHFAQDATRLKAMTTLAGLKKPDEAKAIYDQLIANNPQSGLLGEWYFYRSMCSFSKGEFDIARIGFRALYDTLPVGKWHAQAKCTEGECCSLLSDKVGARTAFQEVVSKFGGTSWAKAAQARLAAMQADEKGEK